MKTLSCWLLNWNCFRWEAANVSDAVKPTAVPKWGLRFFFCRCCSFLFLSWLVLFVLISHFLPYYYKETAAAAVSAGIKTLRGPQDFSPVRLFRHVQKSKCKRFHAQDDGWFVNILTSNCLKLLLRVWGCQVCKFVSWLRIAPIVCMGIYQWQFCLSPMCCRWMFLGAGAIIVDLPDLHSSLQWGRLAFTL